MSGAQTVWYVGRHLVVVAAPYPVASISAYLQASEAAKEASVPAQPIPTPSDDDGSAGTSGAPAIREAHLQPRSQVERRPARTRQNRSPRSPVTSA